MPAAMVWVVTADVAQVAIESGHHRFVAMMYNDASSFKPTSRGVTWAAW